MRLLGSMAFLWLLTLSASSVDAGSVSESAEIKWAKGIAADFLDALLSGEATRVAAAAMLVSPEFHSGVKGAENNTFAYLWKLPNFQKYAFRSVERAPTGKEMVFRGKLHASEKCVGTAEPLEADFTVRVSEMTNGTWSIRFLHIKLKPR